MGTTRRKLLQLAAASHSLKVSIDIYGYPWYNTHIWLETLESSSTYRKTILSTFEKSPKKLAHRLTG